MDFIEQWFEISPDGGSGATELLYTGVALFLGLIVAGRWIAPLMVRARSRRTR